MLPVNENPSKMQLCVDILRLLKKNGSMEKKQLYQEIAYEHFNLEWAISFLKKQLYIQQETIANKTEYSNTAKGLLVSHHFKKIDFGSIFWGWMIWIKRYSQNSRTVPACKHNYQGKYQQIRARFCLENDIRFVLRKLD